MITINNTYDFQVGRRLHNLDQLRQIGFNANRRVLEVETLSHDCHIGMEAFQWLQQPVQIQEQRASALRFGDKRVQALFTALCLFALQPHGFTNKALRPLLAQLLGWSQKQMTQGRMSYDLRRLCLHRIIQRIEKSQRYKLTNLGLRTVLLRARTYQRVLRSGLSILHDLNPNPPSKLARAFNQFQAALDGYFHEQRAT